MSGYPEKLDKVLLTLEEENELRAMELEGQEHVAELMSPPPREIFPTSPNPSGPVRRGSIAISRFGQLSASKSRPNTPKLSTIAAKSPFYQAQAANMSDGSFASGASDLFDEYAHNEDCHQVTQVEQIAGKPGITKAVNNILPRRLNRTQSANVLTTPTQANLVIGVSVQEFTTEASDNEEELGTRVTVSAPGSSLRRRTLTNASGAGWIARAKTLTQKLKGKDRQPTLP